MSKNLFFDEYGKEITEAEWNKRYDEMSDLEKNWKLDVKTENDITTHKINFI